MTPTEARISAIVGTVFSLLILLAVFEEYSIARLSLVFLVLFWIPMLVVHELGHALMARALGWHVHEIVIGFGGTIWEGSVGDTRLRIKLAPVEGYVLPSPATPDNIRQKSMLIYAAGPGAELLILAGMLLVFGWDGLFAETRQVSMIAWQSLAIVILLGAGFNLLPFRSEGAVSDGLGIISSPFMAEETIQLRLLLFPLRQVRLKLENQQPAEALQILAPLIARYPDNDFLRLLKATALSGNGDAEAAREYVRQQLERKLSDRQRRDWLHMQAQIELEADDANYFTLDAALQKAFSISPRAVDLLASKGLSLVLRGRSEEGGNMLADAWRRNDGSADDAVLLAGLAIAAHRCGDPTARNHFRQAFDDVNRSSALAMRVRRLMGET